MPLFHIQDCDRPGYVIAKDYQDAVDKWKKAVSKENWDCEEIELPKGVQLLADDNEIIIDDDWIEPLK